MRHHCVNSKASLTKTIELLNRALLKKLLGYQFFLFHIVQLDETERRWHVFNALPADAFQLFARVQENHNGNVLLRAHCETFAIKVHIVAIIGPR